MRLEILTTEFGDEIGVAKLKAYRIALPTGESYLPIMRVKTPAAFTNLRNRGIDLIERLGMAFDLLADGATLDVSGGASSATISVNDRYPHDFQMCTILPQDQLGGGSNVVSPEATARYVVALLEVYRQFFLEFHDPRQSPVVQHTVDGAILLGLFLTAQSLAENEGRQEVTASDIQMAINIESPVQRYRLFNLALTIPTEWH